MPLDDTGYGGGRSPVAQKGTIVPGSLAVFVEEGVIAGEGGGEFSFVPEAPIGTGLTYGRKDAQWVPVSTNGGGSGGTGTVTAITAGTGLTGGTITSAGTIGLQVPVSLSFGGTGVSVTSYPALLSVIGAAPLNSPAFTGAPRSQSPPAPGDNSTQLATTGWVTSALAGVGTPPLTLTNDVTGSGTGTVATTVVALRGRTISPTAPLDGQMLAWNQGALQWQPTPPPAGGGTGAPPGGATGAVQINAGGGNFGGVTMAGDATWNTTTGALTLANVNANVGTFQGLTVNAKGQVTAAANQNYLTGNQTINLTGSVTGSGTTSIATTIAANAVVTAALANSNVTYAKIQNVTAARLLGNPTGAAAAPSEISLGTGLSFSGTVLNATVSGGNVTAGTLTTNALVLGTGATAIGSVASLGTTATVLHGNAGGAPTWGAVGLTTDVTGILPIANGGTNASTAGAALTNLGGLSTATAATTYAPIASPTFTGVPLAPTPTAGTNNTQIATTAFVANAVGAAGGGNISGTLTANQFTYGTGANAISSFAGGAVGTVLHGAGTTALPTWGAVSLTTDVTGILPPANLGTGTASNQTFLRGDGIFAPVATSGTAGQMLIYSGAGQAIGSGGLTANVANVTSMRLGLGSDATGDIYYNGGGGVLTRLGAGTAGYVLTSGGPATAPSWAAGPTGGGNVSTSTNLVNNQLVLGSGTTTVAPLAPGTAGNVLQSNGAGNAPTWVPLTAGSGTVTSSPQYQIPYYSVNPTGSTVAGSPQISTDATGILRINRNTVLPPPLAGVASTDFWLVGSNTETPSMLIDSFGTGNVSAVVHRHANGTAAAPTQVVNGDILGIYAWRGYDGSGAYSPTGSAQLHAVAAENWVDATHHGTMISMSTAPPGSATPGTQVLVGPGMLVGSVGNPPGAGMITAAQNAAIPDTVTGGAGLRVIGADNAVSRVMIDGFGGNPGLIFRRAQPLATPGYPANTNVLGAVQFQGGYQNTAPVFSARIAALATEAWGASNQGSQIEIDTTPTGTAGSVSQAVIGPGLTLVGPSGTTAPAGMLAGDLNAVRLFANGQGANTSAVSWIAGTNPNNAVVLIANRAMTVTGISGIPIVANSAAATITVNKNGGSAIHSGNFVANATAGVVQNFTVTAPSLVAGDYLTLSVTSGTLGTSVGNITVYLA